jgi:hypothetical protein
MGTEKAEKTEGGRLRRWEGEIEPGQISEDRSGNGGKTEGEILGRWEGENGECGMRNGEKMHSAWRIEY